MVGIEQTILMPCGKVAGGGVLLIIESMAAAPPTTRKVSVMRKLMKILTALLIVLILIGGGVGGYLWYDTKQKADQLVMAAKPFAEISYGGVEVSPAGSLGINRLRIVPHMVNDVITIGAVRFNAPNILALLKTRWQLERGELPDALSLSVHGFEVPLHGGILGAPLPSSRQNMPLGDLDALGCGQVAHFGGTEWQEMGYDRFIGNIEIGYRLDNARNVLMLRVDSNTRDWATLNMDIGLAIPGSAQSIMELAAQAKPKLASLNVTIQDDGFNRRRNNYCAAKAGKTIDDYLADHVRLLAERLNANGVNPGPGLMAAYRRFLSEGGRIVLTATPPAPIDPAELQYYSAEDIVKLLGLKMQVNGEAVADLSASWDSAKLARALGAEPAPEEPVEEAAPTPSEQVVMIQKSYHPTPVGELGQYVGKIAKLKTVTGAAFRGQLEAVAEGIVKIKIRKSGGSVTLSLRTNEIDSAQVLY
ncbi:MAG: hypothetical protein P9E24_01965 [Candidatus Competibacter sp.]|nr:hypothetical protein [Candidatus Competibacter sp.]MDG4585526.1 hypothetical protein [Candidatus Competibacter sp.]